jgi:hypothetical protein
MQTLSNVTNNLLDFIRIQVILFKKNQGGDFMRTRRMLVLALAAILAVGFGAAGSALAAEKTVKFKIPGCV